MNEKGFGFSNLPAPFVLNFCRGCVPTGNRLFRRHPWACPTVPFAPPAKRKNRQLFLFPPLPGCFHVTFIMMAQKIIRAPCRYAVFLRIFVCRVKIFSDAKKHFTKNKSLFRHSKTSSAKRSRGTPYNAARRSA